MEPCAGVRGVERGEELADGHGPRQPRRCCDLLRPVVSVALVWIHARLATAAVRSPDATSDRREQWWSTGAGTGGAPPLRPGSSARSVATAVDPAERSAPGRHRPPTRRRSWSGAIDSSRIASRDRSLNTGPAEVEPVRPGRCRRASRDRHLRTIRRQVPGEGGHVVVGAVGPDVGVLGVDLLGLGIRPVPVLAAPGSRAGSLLAGADLHHGLKRPADPAAVDAETTRRVGAAEAGSSRPSAPIVPCTSRGGT